MTSPSYQNPTEVREFAEKSVEQARKAFEGFSGAAQKAIAAVDTSAIHRVSSANISAQLIVNSPGALVALLFERAKEIRRTHLLSAAEQRGQCRQPTSPTPARSASRIRRLSPGMQRHAGHFPHIKAAAAGPQAIQQCFRRFKRGRGRRRGRQSVWPCPRCDEGS